MEKEKNILIRGKRSSGFWKSIVVCFLLLSLILGSVQGLEVDVYNRDQSADLSAEAVAVKPDISYRWVHSGKELYYTKIGGQTRFVGIQAVMKVPSKVMVGRYYSIPVYFTRIAPPFIIGIQETIKVRGGKINTNDDYVSEVIPVLPIDVFMSVGIGKHSSRIVCSSRLGVFHIGIRVCEGDMWSHETPIVLVKPIDSSKISEECIYPRFIQSIWIRQPDYRYLTDIPLGVWDGPYMIYVKIDVNNMYLPPDVSSTIDEDMPPVIQPVESRVTTITNKAVQILSSLNKISVKLGSADLER